MTSNPISNLIDKSKVSEFYSGKNIIKSLNQSMYGLCKELLNKIFTQDEISEYKLPKVVVIGDESTGKSSVLERITKCQLFPRDSKICTKCPIRVVMSPSVDGKSSYKVVIDNKETDILDKRDIYGLVLKHMESIPSRKISKKEISVFITETGMPFFEFVDLPGIRLNPKSLERTTKDICETYLKDGNSIVLCTVPATVQSLANCASISLIEKMKVQDHSILVYTMMDKMFINGTYQKDDYKKMVDRLLGRSDDYISVEFSNCVAVINRSHRDEESLASWDDHEARWFKEFSKYIDDTNDRREVTKCMTLDNLFTCTNDLCNNVISEEWKPMILKKVSNSIRNLDKTFQNMGKVQLDALDVIMINAFIKKNLDKAVADFSDKLEEIINNYTFCTEVDEFKDSMIKEQILLGCLILSDNESDDVVNENVTFNNKSNEEDSQSENSDTDQDSTDTDQDSTDTDQDSTDTEDEAEPDCAEIVDENKDNFSEKSDTINKFMEKLLIDISPDDETIDSFREYINLLNKMLLEVKSKKLEFVRKYGHELELEESITANILLGFPDQLKSSSSQQSVSNLLMGVCTEELSNHELNDKQRKFLLVRHQLNILIDTTGTILKEHMKKSIDKIFKGNNSFKMNRFDKLKTNTYLTMRSIIDHVLGSEVRTIKNFMNDRLVEDDGDIMHATEKKFKPLLTRVYNNTVMSCVLLGTSRVVTSDMLMFTESDEYHQLRLTIRSKIDRLKENARLIENLHEDSCLEKQYDGLLMPTSHQTVNRVPENKSSNMCNIKESSSTESTNIKDKYLFPKEVSELLTMIDSTSTPEVIQQDSNTLVDNHSIKSNQIEISDFSTNFNSDQCDEETLSGSDAQTKINICCNIKVRANKCLTSSINASDDIIKSQLPDIL